jgi:RNA-directed DNA polymerase
MYGLPAIDDLSDLAQVSRLSNGLLYKLAKYSDRFYRIIQIRKKAGGRRTISQPSRTLKAIQAWILRNILDRLHVSAACKGFERGQNIRDNALSHDRANAILCCDIENFFPSVTAKQVYYIFREIGYNKTASGLLTSLCTLRGGLPQGAPSSPKLANLACIRLDARLLGYAGKRGMIYTRYADDITLSAAKAPAVCKAVHVVRRIIQSEGFSLNEAKTRIAGPSRRRVVTGLVLSEAGVGIGREKCRTIRAMLHALCKMPPDKTSDTKVRQVGGWLAFVRSVDPKRADSLKSYLMKLKTAYPSTAIENIPVWE